MTFGAVVLKYGGFAWKPAVQGALNLASKCTLLGGQMDLSR